MKRKREGENDPNAHPDGHPPQRVLRTYRRVTRQVSKSFEWHKLGLGVP